MKRVVIAGMGFGGLSAAKALSGKDVEVLMVDRNNYHLFQPLLYQVATAALEQETIAYPVRALARNWRNTRFRQGEVLGVDLEGRRLLLDDGEISYDYLIMAAGSRTNYFGMTNVERNAFDLKRLDQAETLRNQVLIMFEQAAREKDPLKRRSLLTFVIVGGGPTGVEFAGALRELVLHVLARDYPEVSPDETRIVLVEAAGRILSAMPEHLSTYACDHLKQMGVEVKLNTCVADADEERVIFKDGSVIETRTLLWSAGVAATELAGRLGAQQGPAGRVKVAGDLSLSGHPEVFVIGDMACVEQDGAVLPMMAPVATQQGIYAADAIQKRMAGQPCDAPFRYRDKGAMATIGRSSAVAVSGGMAFSGWLAWVVWLLLHLYYLIGFRNRLLVMMNWAFYYFFQERQVRLITGNPQQRK